MLRRCFILGATATVAGCRLTAPGNAPGSVPLAPGTTLIVLRHAERHGEALSQQGHVRARRLVEALAGTEIDAIYTREIPRNLETAAPLAEARGLPVAVIDAPDPAPELARLGAGRTVVWVGNKNNLEAIWTTLGAPGEPPLDYGDMHVLTPGTPPGVDRRRFGT
jgi:hypothetical protein